VGEATGSKRRARKRKATKKGGAMTWGDVGAIFAVLVVGSFIAGAVDTWLEQRKWDKKKRDRGT
jgi:uncharacterized membrane protein YraQ (UPF0718 family)